MYALLLGEGVELLFLRRSVCLYWLHIRCKALVVSKAQELVLHFRRLSVFRVDFRMRKYESILSYHSAVFRTDHIRA